MLKKCINKENRKAAMCACVLIAFKLSDPKAFEDDGFKMLRQVRTDYIEFYMSHQCIENYVEIDFNDAVRMEVSVCAALNFAIMVPQHEMMPYVLIGR